MRALCGLLCFSTLLGAADPAWLKLKTAHFEMYTSAGEKRGRATLLFLEQLRAAFAKISGSEISPRPAIVVAFRSEKEYRPYGAREEAPAYFLDTGNHEYIVMRNLMSENMRVTAHEYMHLIQSRGGARPPVWLNEGIAELYSTFHPIGDKVQIGDILPGHWQIVSSGLPLHLADLLAADHDSPLYNEKDKAGPFYAESWALCHFLMLSQEYRPKLPRLFEALNRDLNSEQAIQEAYGKTPKQLEGELNAYMKSDRFNVLRFDMKLEKSAETPEVQPAPEAERGAVLSSLLMGLKHMDEATAALRELEKSFPDSPDVAAAQTWCALRRNDADEADRAFQRADKLGAKDAELFWRMAGSYRGKSAQRIRLLRRSLELDPSAQEVRQFLGELLLSERQYKEAAAELRQVRKVKPKQAGHFFLALAHANFETGARKEAEDALVLARRYATEEEKERVEEFARYMNRPEPAPAAHPAAPAQSVPEGPDEPREKTLQRRPEAEAQEAQTRPTPPPFQSVEGVLQQVDCLGSRARLILSVEGKRVALLIADPGKVTIKSGGQGQVDFRCGPQSGARRVIVEHTGKVDAATGTTGIVRTIEFP